MTITDNKYLNLLYDILSDGQKVPSRNGTAHRLTDLSCDFSETPLVTVRKTAWKLALREFEWFLSGSNNINDLHPSVHSWWKPWADENGFINNNYGYQFRYFKGSREFKNALSLKWQYTSSSEVVSDLIGGFNQIEAVINNIKSDPYSRRHVITTWNSSDMYDKSTPITNCHGSLIQFFVNPDNTLDMSMTQRSCDMVLGVPHNILQYWAFLMWIAYKTGYNVGKFYWRGGDCHIYDSHVETVKEMLGIKHKNRFGRSEFQDKINLVYNPTSEDFEADDFTLDKKYEPVINKRLELIV